MVYRVAQEALTNVARHAGAGRVAVELTRTLPGDAVLLRISDDGQASRAVRTGRGSGACGSGRCWSARR